MKITAARLKALADNSDGFWFNYRGGGYTEVYWDQIATDINALVGATETETDKALALHDMPLGEAFPNRDGLDTRIVRSLYNGCLSRQTRENVQVRTVGKLLRYTGRELLTAQGFGVTCLNRIRERLQELGLKWRET